MDPAQRPWIGLQAIAALDIVIECRSLRIECRVEFRPQSFVGILAAGAVVETQQVQVDQRTGRGVFRHVPMQCRNGLVVLAQ